MGSTFFREMEKGGRAGAIVQRAISKLPARRHGEQVDAKRQPWPARGERCYFLFRNAITNLASKLEIAIGRRDEQRVGAFSRMSYRSSRRMWPAAARPE